MVQLNNIVPVLLFALTYANPSIPRAESLSNTQSPTATSIAPTASASLTPEEIEELYDLHEKLVDIPSTSLNETAATEFVDSYLADLGYKVERVEVGPGRFNVFAYPSTLSTWPEVLITSHLDTVPPHIPFERRTKNGTVYHYGRGSVDAKAAVAAQIIAAHSFIESQDTAPSLGFLYVVGEEIGGDGMQAFARHAANTTFRAALFGEPTEGKLASGHKGAISVVLDVTGREAHSAYEWLGVNAIDHLVSGLRAVNALEPALPSSPLLGNSTVNTGVVAAGLAGNIVPPRANATVSIRVADGDPAAFRALVREALAPVIRIAEAAGARFNVTFVGRGASPQILDTDVPGLEVAPVFYGTDIPSLPQVEKRYLYGPGTIRVAHTPLEELTQGELVEAAEAYRAILGHLFAG